MKIHISNIQININNKKYIFSLKNYGKINKTFVSQKKVFFYKIKAFNMYVEHNYEIHFFIEHVKRAKDKNYNIHFFITKNQYILLFLTMAK